MNFCKKTKIFLFILLLCGYLFAIKTNILNYKIYKTENFDIYYPEEKLTSILSELEVLLEETLTKNSEYFDIAFDYKIPFFIYYGYQQFLQNTIVDVSEGTGGVTEAFKNRFLVPYTGSRKFLQHVINHEFIHEVQFNILYSGSWRTPLLLKSIFYPNWLLEGLSEYRSSLFVKSTIEMYIRDMALSGKLIPLEHLHNFNHLKPHQILPAYEQSAKLMEFIEKEYGKERLVSMLKLYRDRFDANSVLGITLGINLRRLQQKFFEEMKIEYNYEVEINSMTDFNTKNRISKTGIYPTYYYSPIIYRDKIIYVGDIDGKKMFFVKLKDKQKILISKRIFDNNIDILQVENTRISVSKNGLLCFVGIKDNKSYVYIYDIERKKIKKIRAKEIDLITSSFISDDGSKIFLSGIKNCKSIVSVYDLRKNSYEQIFEDINFVSQVALSKDEKKLVYTKEQPCVKKNVQTWQTDIFIYDLEKQQEQRITSTLSDETFGWFIDDQNLIFVSDYNENYEKKLYGVYNLFLVNLNQTPKIAQLTNIIGGIFYPYVEKDKILLCYYRDFNQHVYEFNLEEILNNNFKSVALEQQILQEEISIVSSGGVKKTQDYRLKFSTDLFFPALYYSSYEGLLMVLYWQGSDMVGEHNILLNTIVLGDKNYDYNLMYQFLKFRPGIILNVSGEKSYDYMYDFSKTQTEFDFGISYPINNISYINFIFGYINKFYKDEIFFNEYVRKENILYLNYLRNTIDGKYIEPIKGSYNQVSLQISEKLFDGDYSYQILKYNFLKYIHLGKEHSLFFNSKILYSTGRDKIFFNLGGPENIAGIWYDNVKSQQVYILRLGYRFPVVYDINYHMWFMFPDFFFKGFYTEPFIDFGWDKDFYNYNSFGVKFKFNTFVLQTYLLKLELIFAKKFKPDTTEMVTYFNISGGI